MTLSKIWKIIIKFYLFNWIYKIKYHLRYINKTIKKEKNIFQTCAHKTKIAKKGNINTFAKCFLNAMINTKYKTFWTSLKFQNLYNLINVFKII